MLATEDVLEVLVIQLLGIVPEDENIIVHANKGIPISLDGQSAAAQAFRNIAKRILGQDVPFMPLSEQPRILDRMRRLVGRG